MKLTNAEAAGADLSVITQTNKPIDAVGIKIENTSDSGLDLTNATIEIRKNTGNVSRDNTTINDLNLMMLIEANAVMGDGFYKETYATLGGSSKLSVIEGVIQLANYGIMMAADEEVIITLKSLTSDDAVTIYGLENNVKAATMHQLNKVDITNVTEKTINVAQAEAITIPQTNLDHIEIFYKQSAGGGSIKMLPQELDFRLMQHNSVTSYRTDDKTVSRAETGSYYTIDINDAETIYVKTTGNSFVVIWDTK